MRSTERFFLLFLSPRTTKLNPLLPSCVLMNYKFLTWRLSFLSITVQLCKCIALEHLQHKTEANRNSRAYRRYREGLRNKNSLVKKRKEKEYSHLPRLWSQAAWVWNLTQTLISCVALGKWLIHACFLNYKNESNNTYLAALSRGLKEPMHEKHLTGLASNKCSVAGTYLSLFFSLGPSINLTTSSLILEGCF